jgi:nucleotide-binding universal stress UspA family protein
MKRSDDTPPAFAFRTLLVPVDLTPASDRVLGRLALLPLAPDARLTLLHVVPSHLPPEAQRRAEREAKRALAEEARHLATSLPRGVTVVPLVRAGAPASEIAARSAEVGAEMIVMGRSGGRALRDHFLGSTAERVLRRTALPVLVVRLPARAPYRRPALALAFDGAARAALAQLLKVVPPSWPRVTVIHAYDPPYHGHFHPDEAEYRERYRREAVHDVRTLMAAALSDAKVPARHAPGWNTHVRFGSPTTIVAKAAKDADTDLLVMGTRGRSGVAYVFLGTVAGDVLREVACDVLVVPPRRTGGGRRQ